MVVCMLTYPSLVPLVFLTDRLCNLIVPCCEAGQISRSVVFFNTSLNDFLTSDSQVALGDGNFKKLLQHFGSTICSSLVLSNTPSRLIPREMMRMMISVESVFSQIRLKRSPPQPGTPWTMSHESHGLSECAFSFHLFNWIFPTLSTYHSHTSTNLGNHVFHFWTLETMGFSYQSGYETSLFINYKSSNKS